MVLAVDYAWLTLVFMILNSLGDSIIATREVEKSISSTEMSPADPFSAKGVWKTREKGSVE